ncbi:MAG: PAS domain-containing protein, partial [Bilophila sp.]
MNRLRLGIKFTLGFGAILLLTLFLGVTGYQELSTISVESGTIAAHLVPQLELSAQVQKELNRTEILFSHAIRSSDEKDAAATIESLDDLDKAYKALAALSTKQPGLKNLASFVRDSDSLLKEYTESIRNTLTLQKSLTAYQNTMDVAAASLERGAAGLSGSFMADIFSKIDEGGDELRTLVTGQFSVTALQKQIQTMRREVQRAILHRSPDDVTAQIRRIPDLQYRFERLEDTVHEPDRKQTLVDARGDLKTYLTDLRKVHDGFVAQAKSIERQSNICTSLLKLTEELAEQSTSNIKENTRAAASNAESTTRQMLALLVVTTLLTFVIAVLTTRGITVPIRQGVAFAAEVARGSFAARWETPLKDEIGELAASLNTAFTKVADKAHWYESVLNSVPFNISVTDMDMKWTFMNSFGLKALGRKDLSEVLGRCCTEKGGDLCNTPKCGILALRRGESTVTFRTSDGRIMHVQLHYLADSQGNRIGHVEISNDITQEETLREEAANAMQRGRYETAADLEQVVAALGNASMHLSAQIEQCDAGTERASAQLSETSTAMEEMNATV